jgi:hypothetical protein
MCNANKQGKRGNTMNRKMVAEIFTSMTKEKITEGAGTLSSFLTIMKLDHKGFNKMKPAERGALMAACLIEYGRKSAKENETQ